MELRKGLRLMPTGVSPVDVVTLIEPCDGGWRCRVSWWWREPDGKWVRRETHAGVMRTTDELAAFKVARYADPNRNKP
jgi:hypothetical protein